MSDTVTVELSLGDSIYVLEPKLSAMKTINRMAGGYAGAFRALQNFDADVMVAIVVAGVGATGQAAKKIEEGVYKAGVDDLQAPLVRFVNICAAGGRDPDLKAKPTNGAADEKN